MFQLSHDHVTLRPVDRPDFERLLSWYADHELGMLAGWGVIRSRSAFEAKWDSLVTEPPADLRLFGIEHAGELVGRIELAKIDHEQRHAALGFFIGERSAWGKGIATLAVRLMLDYAFTAENLERIYADTYAFNTRSQRVLAKAGFVHEGILRQHEVHHGARRDLHTFGILKPEFYARFPSVLPQPD